MRDVLWSSEGQQQLSKALGGWPLSGRMKWSDEILGWQRPCGQAGVVTMMVKKNAVVSETFGSLAMESPLEQKQGSLSADGSGGGKILVSGTWPGLDSQCRRVSSPSNSWT